MKPGREHQRTLSNFQKNKSGKLTKELIKHKAITKQIGTSPSPVNAVSKQHLLTLPKGG